MNQPSNEAAEVAALIKIFKEDIAKFAKLVFNSELRPIQLEFAEAFRTQDKITFRGGTGFGKTHALAIMVWWSLICHSEVKVTVIGPTEDQLKNGIWPEVGSLYERMHPLFKQAFKVTAEGAERIGSPDDCYAVIRLCPKDNPSALRGVHKKNNFCLVDEATGVSDEAFDVLYGVLDDKNGKFCLISNPSRTDGYFWRTWNDPLISNEWTKVHGTSFDNPDFTEKKHLARIAQCGGKETRQYRTMVLGEFPDSNADGMIARSLVEAAAQNTDVVFNPASPWIWGVDPAGDGAESDRSVLAIRNDRFCTDIKTFNGLDAVQLAYKIRDLYQATPKSQQPSVIAVDAIGVGFGCYSILKEFGLPAKEIKVSNRPTRSPEKYNRLRDQIWWECREWFATENCRIPNNAELISELTLPTYDTDNGKIRVEEKKAIKKRLKGNSPDLADALCLTFAVSATRYASKYSWSKPIRHKNLSRYE